ncbi:MAG TPA: OsmC family protein [Bryobacteraceae bacterium]|jgi:putative redox protein|nr:OsmC family protein [Bryobacteraceae bacterium]
MADQMKVNLHQISVSASEAEFRDHRVRIDRPVSKGGSDAGPMGGELFLAAVGGCFTSNLLAAIRARDARISDVKVEVTAVVDGTPSKFVSMELLVSAQGEDLGRLDKLIQIAERGCIMINTLQGNVPVTARIHATAAAS